MADWKTYAKAARNTARKQGPGARDAARRASDRAGGYVRAAGKAIDEGRRHDDAPPRSSEGAPRRRPSEDAAPRRTDESREAPRRQAAPSSSSSRPSGPRTSTAQRPAVDTDRLVKDAAAYYTVASRRVAKVNLVPRVLRALRDALLIGISLVAIWAVLAAAGIPIPFTTVLIIVGAIVAVSFGAGLYAQWKRSRDALDAAEDPRDR